MMRAFRVVPFVLLASVLTCSLARGLCFEEIRWEKDLVSRVKCRNG